MLNKNGTIAQYMYVSGLIPPPIEIPLVEFPIRPIPPEPSFFRRLLSCFSF